MKIIIAEDNPVILNLYKTALEKTDYDLILSSNGEKALENLNKTGARMVITDWEMPVMDGLTLCRRIREQRDSEYVYIIFVSSHDSQDDAVAGLDAGADDYIKKPFNPYELISRIRAGERIVELENKFRKTYGDLVHAEKMASVGRLAAGIAHEINNPAGFISGNLDIMEDYHNDLLNLIQKYRKLVSLIAEDGTYNISNEIQIMTTNIKTVEDNIDIDFILQDTRDLLNENKKGITKITDLVRELRTFAHPGEPKEKKTDINREILSVLNIIQKNIKFREQVSVNFGKIPSIVCNPAELNQVFFCLLSNAAKATMEKGRIRISTKTDNKNIIITVSDTGKGIEKNNLSKIFDPFFAADTAADDIDNGRGMSLNTAYNIVKNHGGRIEVRSDMGRGSVFSVILPFSKKEIEGISK